MLLWLLPSLDFFLFSFLLRTNCGKIRLICVMVPSHPFLDCLVCLHFQSRMKRADAVVKTTSHNLSYHRLSNLGSIVYIVIIILTNRFLFVITTHHASHTHTQYLLHNLFYQNKIFLLTVLLPWVCIRGPFSLGNKSKLIKSPSR